MRLARLAILLLVACCTLPSTTFAQRKVDPRRAAKIGIRKLSGQHLRLYTDLPASKAVDELPRVFDAAVPQWAKYFGIPAARVADWRIQGYLMQDRTKFAALGLLPKENPEFVNGFASGHELWLEEQPSDYYRRHLLLHEGTHCFMNTQLGGSGPGWYREGMAELLGTHHWDGRQLQLRYLPARRDEVPMWGRTKLIRAAFRNGKALTLPAVLAIDGRRQWSTEQYAWTWALAQFLDSHPRYQEKFRELSSAVSDRRFNQRFRQEFRDQWSDLLVEWQAFVATLDYGYDAKRMAMQHQTARSVAEDPQTVSIAADRGWQSTGWLLQAGQTYRITAVGRYQIAFDTAPWPCEPGGVTLDYHDGHPLGMLLGALRPEANSSPSASKGQDADADFQHPMAIGLQATLAPRHDAVLYLRVNDSPARLADNQGTLQATILRQ